jgi:hypothetical protein
MVALDEPILRIGPEPGRFGWLSFAATPTFVLMAFATALAGDGRADMLCSAAHTSWSIVGMAPMYLLMSVFHAAPWLRLLARAIRGPQIS